jgi:hypothetical protein
MNIAGRDSARHVGCSHLRRQLYRQPFIRRDSSPGEHIVEKCLDCGANARGPGVFVPRAEVADPSALPVLPGRQAAAQQPGLFDQIDGNYRETPA